MHSSVPPDSAAVNVKLAVVSFVGSSGPVSIVGASGATVSTVKSRSSLPSLPAASDCSTRAV